MREALKYDRSKPDRYKRDAPYREWYWGLPDGVHHDPEWLVSWDADRQEELRRQAEKVAKWDLLLERERQRKRHAEREREERRRAEMR